MSRYEEFIKKFAEASDLYREAIKGNGGFEYRRQVEQLILLSNRMNYGLLCYLFDPTMAQHLAAKYVESNRNLLTFLNQIDDNYRFFILHELKTNANLFAHG